MSLPNCSQSYVSGVRRCKFGCLALDQAVWCCAPARALLCRLAYLEHTFRGLGVLWEIGVYTPSRARHSTFVRDNG